MDANEIKISVIVPIYNIEKEVEHCVQSILTQTHRNLEILLIDDGSTDNSGKIIDRLAAEDARIRAVHTENKGATQARLLGIRQASGEYIGFVDGDDEVEPDMFAFLLQNALKYEADISHCGYQRIYENGRIQPFYNTGRLVLQDRMTGVRDLLEGAFVDPGLWNKLFHRRLFTAFQKDDWIPDDLKINEDLLMNYFLFEAAQCSVYEDVCKYHYLVRDGSASRRSLNEHKLYDPIRVKQILLDRCAADMRPLVRTAYMNTLINVYSSLAAEHAPAHKADRSRVREMIRSECADSVELSQRRRRMLWCILKVPALYGIVYRFYARHIQENPYV